MTLIAMGLLMLVSIVSSARMNYKLKDYDKPRFEQEAAQDRADSIRRNSMPLLPPYEDIRR